MTDDKSVTKSAATDALLDVAIATVVGAGIRRRVVPADIGGGADLPPTAQTPLAMNLRAAKKNTLVDSCTAYAYVHLMGQVRLKLFGVKRINWLPP